MNFLISELFHHFQNPRRVGYKDDWKIIIFIEDDQIISIDTPFVYFDGMNPRNLFCKNSHDLLEMKRNLFEMSFLKTSTPQFHQVIASDSGELTVRKIEKFQAKTLVENFCKSVSGSNMININRKKYNPEYVGVSLGYEFCLHFASGSPNGNDRTMQVYYLRLINIATRFQDYFQKIFNFSIHPFDVLNYLKKLDGFDDPPKILQKFKVPKKLFVKVFEPPKDSNIYHFFFKIKVITSFFSMRTTADIIKLLSKNPYPEVDINQIWGLQTFGHFLEVPCNYNFDKCDLQRNGITLHNFIASHKPKDQMKLFPLYLRFYLLKKTSKPDLLICEDVKQLHKEFMELMNLNKFAKNFFKTAPLPNITYFFLYNKISLVFGKPLLEFLMKHRYLYILRYNLFWSFRGGILPMVKTNLVHIYLPIFREMLFNKGNVNATDIKYFDTELELIKNI